MPEFLPPEVASLQTRLAAFLRDEVAALEDGDPDGLVEAVRELSKRRGFWTLNQPGDEREPLSPLARVVVDETLAACGLESADAVLGPDPGLLRFATGPLEQSHLQPLLDGRKRAAFAFTEPSDATRPTEARRNGDNYRVEGRKSYVTRGGDADFYITLVNVRSEEPNKAGTALLVIDNDLPGIEIERAFQSLDGSHHLALSFNGVEVAQHCLLGGIGEGMPKALRNISDVRLSVAARSSGICLFVLEQLAERLRQPHRSGSPLADHEAIRLRYADLRIAAFAARSALYRTARLADGQDNVVNEIMAVKVLCTETVSRVIDEAIQLAGGQALIVGHPFERLYRQVRTLRLGEGASDLLRLQIARGVFEYASGRC